MVFLIPKGCFLREYTLTDFIEISDRDILKKASLFHVNREKVLLPEWFHPNNSFTAKKGPHGSARGTADRLEKNHVLMNCNDYFSISTHEEILKTAENALSAFGAGMVSFPFSMDREVPHRNFESQLSDVVGREDALLFSSGYTACLGIIPAIATAGDVIIADRMCHHGIIDACRSADALLKVFNHNDLADLKRKIEESNGGGGTCVVVEGVYILNGNNAPLEEISKVCRNYGARLMVDESNTLGVVGDSGFGVSDTAYAEQVDIVFGDFSRPFGIMGGFASASNEVIDFLRQFSRSYLFSPMQSPVLVSCLQKAVEIVFADKSLTRSLQKNIRDVRNALKPVLPESAGGSGHIIPLYCGNIAELSETSRLFQKHNIFTDCLVYPFVPKDRQGPRLGVSAGLDSNDIAVLTQCVLDMASQFRASGR